ncbi:putative peroxidase [Tripterygium wilfordii]|uniref:Putative peroxidase n=1 Tax=Tripterygium wilfordii TaxID=458696 RepID=A0A7J7E471_TRIWF|nr:putative peroxidase [Tripterygium wilfordii]
MTGKQSMTAPVIVYSYFPQPNDSVGITELLCRRAYSRIFSLFIFLKENASSSDQALLSTPKTKDLVPKFASSQGALSEAFMNSMIKMNSMTGGQEVRKDCRVVN